MEPNIYAYVGGNPISFVDPMGLDRCTCPTGNTGDVRLGTSSDTGPLSRQQAEHQTATNNALYGTTVDGFGLAAAISGGVAGLASKAISAGTIAFSAGYFMGTRNGGSRNYVAPGESFRTEFFDHGSHVQMVTERFDEHGVTQGRGATEDCRIGG